MRTVILVVVLTATVLAQTESADSLGAARALYASADYRGALDMLDRLTAAHPALPDQQSIDLYRTFCLVALGKTDEAGVVIASMIARDPLYRPADSDIPPRLRPLFSDKRKATLPSIVQARYERAKNAFERSDYKTAADGFSEVLLVLSDPDVAPSATRPPLSNLRVLAIGFKDLAVRALIPPPIPQSEPAAPATQPPIVSAPKPPKIYDSNDADVVAAVTLKQDMPRFQRPVLADRTGVLFIVIDETGRVESAIITEALDRAYDQLVLAAAKTWTYQPATRSGAPVKYRKRIQLTLSRQTP